MPGLRETLRVNGRARITTDPALLDARRGRQGAAQRHPGDRRGSLFPLRQGADPLRSVEPGKTGEAIRFPSLGRIITEQIGEGSVEAAERYTEESYRTRLY